MQVLKADFTEATGQLEMLGSVAPGRHLEGPRLRLCGLLILGILGAYHLCLLPLRCWHPLFEVSSGRVSDLSVPGLSSLYGILVTVTSEVLRV